MAPTNQDFVKGIDFTGLTSINAGDLNQVVDAASPAADKGLIINTTDEVVYVPTVPDAETTVKWQQYIWIRRLHADDASNTKVLFYAWNPNATSDTTMLKWERIRGIVDADLLDVGDLPALSNFGMVQTQGYRYTIKLTVELVTSLRDINVSYLTNGVICHALGYYEIGDDGGGWFRFDSTSVATDNAGTVFTPATGNGRWIRVVEGSDYYAEWYGAKGDGATDDSAAIQACIDEYKGVTLKDKTYIIGTWIKPRDFMHLKGQGKTKTVLKLADNMYKIHPERFVSDAARWYGMVSSSAGEADDGNGVCSSDSIIEGILFDNNYRGQPEGYKLTCDTVRLSGAANIVRDCAFIDFGSGCSLYENFVVNLATDLNKITTTDLRGSKVFNCEFYEPADNSSVFKNGGHTPEITLINAGGHVAVDDWSLTGIPAGDFALGVEIANCRFINIQRDQVTQYQAIHCITTAQCDGANIHDNYAINVDGAGYYEDSWHNKNLCIHDNVFININCGIHINSGGPWTENGHNYCHRVFGLTITNNTIVARAANANYPYSYVAACVYFYLPTTNMYVVQDCLISGNNFKAQINEIANVASIEYNTGYAYMIRGATTADNYITYNNVKYYNGETFDALSGITTFTVNGSATVSKVRLSRGILFHTGHCSMNHITIDNNLIDCNYAETYLLSASAGNYKTIYAIMFLNGYSTWQTNPEVVLVGDNKTPQGEVLRCAIMTYVSAGIWGESWPLENNLAKTSWTIPYYISPSNVNQFMFVKDNGAFNAASDEYLRGNALYKAVIPTRCIPSGQILPGITYMVKTDGSASSYITYGSSNYTNNQLFVGINGTTTYARTGYAEVHVVPMDCVLPVSYPRNYVIEEVSGSRSGTHGALTSTFTLNGFFNLKKGLEGIIKLVFNNDDAVKTVNFPDPANYCGRTFKLCVYVPALTSSRDIKLAATSAWLVNNTTMTIGTSITLGTSSTTEAKAMMVDIISDGTYWYVNI